MWLTKQAQTLQQLHDNSLDLPEPRQLVLQTAVADGQQFLENHASIDYVFVCTHNSRRSQFSEFWARVAAQYYASPQLNSRVRFSSCGIETTSCNPRTVAALARNGFHLSEQAEEALGNPHYRLSEPDMGIALYSKIFGDSEVPQKDFVAMMCCDDVDQRCPIIPGALARIPLHYVDPKHSDDSDHEQATYDERSQQIGAEMFFFVRACIKDMCAD